MGLVADAPYHKLCYDIIGAAMFVHNKQGPGHREKLYQRSLTAKLRNIGLKVEEEVRVEIDFESRPVGLLYLDHLVEDAVIVEDKAFSHMLTNEDIAQVITYLAATACPWACYSILDADGWSTSAFSRLRNWRAGETALSVTCGGRNSRRMRI